MRLKKLLKIALSIAVTAGVLGDYLPSVSASASSPNTHGIPVGYVNQYKDVKGSDRITITGNDMPNVPQYGLTISDVNVDGSYAGMVATFSDLGQSADRGWPYVDVSEAKEWIAKFGGNEAWILGGSTIYSASISHPNVTPSPSYPAYNLAEIAAASGGRGTSNGTWSSITTSNPDEKYKMTLDFQSSPRPEGWVSTNKSVYNLNEKVTVTAGGKDYSFYDKGLIISELQVINKTTGREWRSLLKDTTIDGTGTPTDNPYMWSQNFEYLDTAEVGTYEVSLILTDKHHRTPEGSPSMSQAKVITTTFEVQGNVLTCDKPASATLSIQGQSDVSLSGGGTYNLPAGINTITLQMIDSNTKTPIGGTLTVNGQKISASDGKFVNVLVTGPSTTISFESTDKHYCWTKDFIPQVSTGGGGSGNCSYENIQMHVWRDFGSSDTKDSNLSSGGTMNVDKTNFQELRIEAPETGDFFYKYSGDPLDHTGYFTGPANVMVYRNVPISSTSPIIVKFVSSSGANCWYYTFKLVDMTTQPVDCPKVYQKITTGGGWGDDPELRNGATLNLNLNDSLELYSTYYDPNEGQKLNAYVTWKMQFPDGTIKTIAEDRRAIIPDWGDPSIAFNKVGTYKIWHDYTGYKDWEGHCQWQITIHVARIDCSDISAVAYSSQAFFEYTGTGTAADPYRGSKEPGEKVWTTLEASHSGLRIPADWEISGGEYTTPLKISNESFYQMYFKAYSTPVTYTIKATINYQGLTCEKVFYIQFSPYSCDNTSVSATVNGSSASLQNDTLRLVIGKQPSYDVDFKALHDGSTNNVTGDWVLQKDGTSESYTSIGKNPFAHTFTDTSPATYTLTIKVKIGSLECPKTIKIELSGTQCSDLVLHVYNSKDAKWRAFSNDGSTFHEEVYISQPVDWKVVITDSLQNPDTGGTKIKVAWTADLANQSTTPSTEYLRKGTSTQGEYHVKAVVNDPNYPQLNGCTLELYFKVYDTNASCDGIYMHVYDSIKGDFTYNVQKGGTVTIKLPTGVTKVDQIGVTLTVSATDAIDVVNADYSGSPRSNESADPKLAFVVKNVTKGTYTVTGTVNDTKFPNAKGCRFDVTIIVDDGTMQPPPPPCSTCQPGGEIDGGTMKLRVFDSGNRLLTGSNDGVWEREPARIEVQINQSQIQAAFAKADTQINQAIQDKIEELKQKYADPAYEEVVVTATPHTWQAQSSPQTKWPDKIILEVNGPNGEAGYPLNPKLASQSNTYSETTLPTQTTWRLDLHPLDYQAKIKGFQIEAAYKVAFTVHYQKCEMVSPGEDEKGNPLPLEKKCTPGTDSAEIANSYSINVQGDETKFEVFEPNAKGFISHTSEWAEYHARDRYPNSKPNDYYAGERILARVQLEDRHRHPVSGQFPQIQAVTAWISETGKKGKPLQSSIQLIESGNLWTGPNETVPKLGIREIGVDIASMGDKVSGFAKGQQYAVYFQVKFGFGVKKGYGAFNKTVLTGHNQADYRNLFTIIANAWERQGIRNHTKH